MALHKPYLDIPGTTIFDADQSRQGYHLNQFCRSEFFSDGGKSLDISKHYCHLFKMLCMGDAVSLQLIRNSSRKNIKQ